VSPSGDFELIVEVGGAFMGPSRRRGHTPLAHGPDVLRHPDDAWMTPGGRPFHKSVEDGA
jgi:hypothetical protein